MKYQYGVMVIITIMSGNGINKMSYRMSGEALWTFLSLFTLPVEKQIELIGGLTDDEQVTRDKFFVSNSLLLSNAIWCRRDSWIEDFDFLYDYERQGFSELQIRFNTALSNTSQVDIYKKDYIESEQWRELRRVGLEILERSGLPPNPPESAIDFNEYLEIVIDPEHGLICINC